jgi:hypothetical protein
MNYNIYQYSAIWAVVNSEINNEITCDRLTDQIMDVLDTLNQETTITRVEVIDENGRSYVNWNKENIISYQLQDDDTTLKVFVNTATDSMNITEPKPVDISKVLIEGDIATIMGVKYKKVKEEVKKTPAEKAFYKLYNRYPDVLDDYNNSPWTIFRDAFELGTQEVRGD